MRHQEGINPGELQILPLLVNPQLMGVGSRVTCTCPRPSQEQWNSMIKALLGSPISRNDLTEARDERRMPQTCLRAIGVVNNTGMLPS